VCATVLRPPRQLRTRSPVGGPVSSGRAGFPRPSVDVEEEIRASATARLASNSGPLRRFHPPPRHQLPQLRRHLLKHRCPFAHPPLTKQPSTGIPRGSLALESLAHAEGDLGGIRRQPRRLGCGAHDLLAKSQPSASRWAGRRNSRHGLSYGSGCGDRSRLVQQRGGSGCTGHIGGRVVTRHKPGCRPTSQRSLEPLALDRF
jgi:hypothetical protein